MRYPKIVAVAALGAALTLSACNRPQQTDETAREDTTAADRERQQDEAARMEQRISDLEREWKEKEAQTTNRADAETTSLRAEIKEELNELRQAAADLRTTTAENWWERTERDIERTADEVEADVRRFARNWTAPAAEPQVGTAGTETAWEARRERMVARLRARIEAMENALKDVDVRSEQRDDADDTRARVQQLRKDVDRLERADENDWWDVTRDRVNDYIDRVEAAINRTDPNKAG